MKFFAIMRRDLRKLIRNPITLITTILMPIVYLVIIGNSFQGQLKHLPLEYVYATNFLPLGRKDSLMFWGWSLALEEQFYLTVPLLFFVLGRLKTIARASRCCRCSGCRRS